MKKRLIAGALMVLISLVCEAHEFWLLTPKFRYNLNEEMLIAFMVGENFSGEPWDLKTHKIEKLDLHTRLGVTDLRKMVQPNAKIKLKVKLMEPGTQLVTLQSDYSYIEMEGEKFNAYLKDDGLDEALKFRTATHSLATKSREFYARFVKLMIQVGEKTDDTYKKKTGLRIEIIPLQNPYALKVGDHLECQVLVEGRPAAHQLVRVWNKIAHSSFEQNIYTENDGTIRFPINAQGRWMVSTVKMIPSEKPGAEWQSMWSSLVFAI